ncbi:6b059853-dbd1-4f3a-bf40-c7bdab650e3a [Sclerotinia trifoliorum]|uniref:6b059853-dbd1-4f3a-bf40-c7bdab650e3a n=1 Tax=Sclerotinia trifoliorum TaxID=28548 RepID=A0A8H2VUJ4_9HELO|nr:6b059853-dbd1-4f3a-bf40-c7bdab650e3a [Sclerotinia trifoliorum]
MSTTLTEQASSEHITTLNTNPTTTPHDVEGIMNYYLDPEDGSPPPPNIVGKPTTFETPVNPVKVTVHDIRGSEDQHTLDTTGFQIVNHVSQEKNFIDDENIKGDYYKETEELLKRETGASKIFIFDHTIRREAPNGTDPAPITTETPKDNSSPVFVQRGPVQRVHIDQSYSASVNRVPYHLPEEADELLKGRFQIINVWRPIKTIFKDPLGVAAANSVDEKDLVPIKLIYPDREGETYAVRYDPGHKWHYLYKQTPAEVLLIKCFDSKTDGRARRVPHSAFVNLEHEGGEKRESIEVRALVFYPSDTE